MSAQHTAGPWLQYADTHIVICKHSGADRSEDLRICEVAMNTRRDEGRHNINLIIAAPDLLLVAQAGISMRRAQAAYFKSRTKDALISSKAAEKDFDRIAVAAVAKAIGSAA